MMTKALNTKKLFTASVVTILLMTLAATALALTQNLRINLTDSMTQGIYQVSPASNIQRGDRLQISLPCPQVNGRCPFGFVTEKIGDPMQLLKKVAGLPGDTLEIKADAIVVNGERYPLQSIPSIYAHEGMEFTLPHGHYFVASKNPMSFDSRYFGLVPESAIQGRARLLWSFE